MGTASTSQRPSFSSEQSSDSSPSSEASNQSNQQRELQMQWVEMGLQGSSNLPSHSAHPQDLISPGHPGLLSFENLDVNTLHSPYTPPTALSELPSVQSPYSMSQTFAPAMGRPNYPQRSSSTSGLGQPSTTNFLIPQFPHSAPAANANGRSSGFPSNPGMPITRSPSTVFTSPLDEVEELRRIVQELQTHNQELLTRVNHLQGELSAARFAQASGMASPTDAAGHSTFTLPTVPNMSQNGQAQPSAQTDASWRRRTEARVRKFCSPNRAGNALCAWHDTRRERRAYPPRMAPAGTLNCGCTVTQALFEETLSRHGVGSYLPSETVRMDPALRNPLLRLLETRYGYRDGDFERDPLTDNWVEGEGPERWEMELQRHGGKCHR